MDAVATGLIGLGGVALGLIGTAAIEWVKRTASRRDAANERQAAVLREIQEVLDEFARQWTSLIDDISQGKADLQTLPLSSEPSLVLSRYMVLTRRVRDDRLRRELQDIAAVAHALAEAGERGGDLSLEVAQVQNHLGPVLRSLQ
jgi:hypothetical protein